VEIKTVADDAAATTAACSWQACMLEEFKDDQSCGGAGCCSEKSFWTRVIIFLKMM
jgi:hypothetical protein